MIRRHRGHNWLLIPQHEHARLAGEVATAWGNAATPPLPLAEPLLAAIFQHDQGWIEWERNPTVDPATGIPREFTEMPLPVSAAIWEKSIARCAGDSAWGGLWVSRHFCWLGQRGRDAHLDHEEEVADMDRFLATQQELQEGWRQMLRGSYREQELAHHEEFGFRALQFFDALSLWLCCTEQPDPKELPFPTGQTYRLAVGEEGRISLSPGPLRNSPLTLQGTGLRIPAQELPSDAEYRQVLATALPEKLEWTILDSNQ